MGNYYLPGELQEMCNYACEEVLYYKTLFIEHGISVGDISPEEFYRIPYLTPKIIQKEMNNFLAAKFHYYPDVESIIAERAISSQGYYLKNLWSKYDYIISQKILNRLRGQFFDINSNPRYVCFHTASYQDNLIIDPKPIEVGELSLSILNDGLGTESIDQIYNAIMDFNPSYITMHLSIAKQLANHIQQKKKSIPAGLNYIELTAGKLSAHDYSLVESAFGIRPKNNYTVAGVNCVAHECEHGHMHVLGENVYVETIKNGHPVFNEIGEIVVTSLTNYAMPLIRYRTGDLGLLSSSDCPCGNVNPILKFTSGREVDPIVNNQNNINRHSIKGLIEYTNEHMSGAISRVQVQFKDGSITVQMTLKPAYYGWEEAVKQNFLKNAIKPNWNNLHWDLMFVREK